MWCVLAFFFGVVSRHLLSVRHGGENQSSGISRFSYRSAHNSDAATFSFLSVFVWAFHLCRGGTGPQSLSVRGGAYGCWDYDAQNALNIKTKAVHPYPFGSTVCFFWLLLIFMQRHALVAGSPKVSAPITFFFFSFSRGSGQNKTIRSSSLVGRVGKRRKRINH